MKRKYLIIGCAFFCFAVSLILIRLINVNSQPQQPESKADEYVSHLWSEDEVKRTVAKDSLIRMGSNAEKPLIALLEDLTRNPGLRFVPGKEKEGAQVRDEVNKLPPSERSLEGLNRLKNLEISWRLRNDAYEILGAIRSLKAIPILIELMEQEENRDANDGLTPELRALVQIGSPAVPYLISSLEKAEIAISTSEFPNDSAIQAEKQNQSLIKMINRRRQIRAALVLGEIGDIRALPTLEHLLQKNKERYFARVIQDSVNRIKEKQK